MRATRLVVVVVGALLGCSAPAATSVPTGHRCADGSSVPQFEDVSVQAGLPRLALDPWMSVTATDCAQIEDLDGDGHADLVFLWDHALRIGWGHGDATFDYDSLPLRNSAQGCMVVDVDGDGMRDVLLPRAGEGSLLFRQTSTRVLEDVTASAHLGMISDASRAAAALDVDRDGDLDLFVGGRAEPQGPWSCRDLDGTHVHCDPAMPLASSPDSLLVQDHGVFTSLGTARGIAGDAGSALAAATFDVDGDGTLDLLVGNDFGSNELYRGSPDAFTSITSSMGLDAYNHAMGIGLFDYDLDGDLDAFVTEVGADLLLHREGASFVDRSIETFVAEGTADHYSWGIAIADYDNDGDEDVYAATNYAARSGRLIEMLDMLPATSGSQSSAEEAVALIIGVYAGPQGDDLLVNCGDGTFESRVVATELDRGSYVAETPASTGDVDEDGRMDVFANGESMGPRLLHNVTPDAGHAIEIVLRGGTEPEAIGALVEVTADGRVQRRLRHVGSAGGHPGGVLHVGIGSSTTADVRVHWPDGMTSSVDGVHAGEGILRVVHP